MLRNIMSGRSQDVFYIRDFCAVRITAISDSCGMLAVVYRKKMFQDWKVPLYLDPS